MQLFLVHHGEAVVPDLDARRPLSESGRAAVERLAEAAASRGVKPAVVWHSGKLRSKQTAEAFWRSCNALAEFSATRNVQPDDPPQWFADHLRGETRDILVAGHFPHLPRLLAVLLKRSEAEVAFPPNGVVALASEDEGDTWIERWRLAP